MHFDMGTLPEKRRYKLLSSLVVPRPIAWVSTVSAQGMPNLAPYSFFNVMGHDPAVVALGILAHPEKPLKDTAHNIETTGRFTISLVTEALAVPMNATAADLPHGTDETAELDLALAPAIANGIPGIAAAPVRLECLLLHALATSDRQRLIVGSVIAMHVDDALVLDPERLTIDLTAYAPVARMGGAGIYCRSTDRFELDRPDRSTQPLD